MKSYIKLSHIFLSALFIFCFGSCWAQNSVESEKKINVMKDSINNVKEIRFVKRNNSNEIVRTILTSEIAVISENKSKVLVITEDRSSSENSKAQVYNEYGQIEKEFNVKTSSYCEFSNDGKLAFFGGLPEESTDGIWTKSHLFFYNVDGKKIEGPNRTFGIANYSKFSDSGKHFIFLADSVFSGHDPMVTNLYIFDEKFNVIGYHSFTDWPLFSFFENVIIHEPSERIIIHNHFGSGHNLTKQTITLDFKGNIIERREGW